MREEHARTREIDLRKWAPEAAGPRLLEELDALALGECARVRLPAGPGSQLHRLADLGFETIAAGGTTEGRELLVWRYCDALAGLVARHQAAST